MPDPAYPKRSSFHANRLIRMLNKSCAANEIGVEACWLITTIALVEDSKRYTGAVTFWTGQILPVTGLTSWGRLDRARRKAVSAGWLHYKAGTKSRAAEYWTLIPAVIVDAYEDSPLDASDIHHQNGDESRIDHQNGDDNGDPSVIHPGSKRGYSRPTPNPAPSSRPNRFADSDLQTAEFIWNLIQDMQPDRRQPKLDKWADSVRLMRERDNRTDDQIRELFTWCNRDPFWKTNILSPDKLRTQWDDLQLRRETSERTDQVPNEAEAIWNDLCRFIAQELDRQQPYSEILTQRFGPRVAAAVKATGVLEIKDANDFRLRDLRKTFLQNYAQTGAAA